MLIRCEKCSMLYELDETLIPTGGAPVQCSKCQFVFRAYPPPPAATPAPASASLAPLPDPLPAERSEGGAGRTEAPPAESSTPGAVATPQPAPAPPEPPRSSSALRAPASGPAPEVKFTRDGRPIRKVPFPEDAATLAAGTASRASARGAARVPVPVKGRASPLLRWILPLAVALAVAAGVLAWRLLARRVDPSAAQRRSEGHSLLLPAPAGRGPPDAPPRGTGGPSAEN